MILEKIGTKLLIAVFVYIPLLLFTYLALVLMLDDPQLQGNVYALYIYHFMFISLMIIILSTFFLPLRFSFIPPIICAIIIAVLFHLFFQDTDKIRKNNIGYKTIVNNDITNWKNYSNSKYNISLKYPPDLSIGKDTINPNTIRIETIDPTGDSKNQELIYISTIDSTQINGIKKICLEDLKSEPETLILKNNTFTICKDNDNSGSTNTENYAWIKKPNSQEHFLFEHLETPPDKIKNLEKFKQILNTIEL